MYCYWTLQMHTILAVKKEDNVGYQANLRQSHLTTPQIIQDRYNVERTWMNKHSLPQSIPHRRTKFPEIIRWWLTFFERCSTVLNIRHIICTFYATELLKYSKIKSPAVDPLQNWYILTLTVRRSIVMFCILKVFTQPPTRLRYPPGCV